MDRPKRTLQRWEGQGHVRFLTFSCFRRHRLFDNDRIKARLVEHLGRATSKQGVELVAWVVMPEHVHLVLNLGDVAAGSFLRSLKRPFATEVLDRWRELDAAILPKLRDRPGTHHFWQKGGGFDRNLVTAALVEQKIDYCHQNPVKRGLVAAPEDWSWSSARCYAHRSDYAGPPIAT